MITEYIYKTIHQTILLIIHGFIIMGLLEYIYSVESEINIMEQ